MRPRTLAPRVSAAARLACLCLPWILASCAAAPPPAPPPVSPAAQLAELRVSLPTFHERIDRTRRTVPRCDPRGDVWLTELDHHEEELTAIETEVRALETAELSPRAFEDQVSTLRERARRLQARSMLVEDGVRQRCANPALTPD